MKKVNYWDSCVKFHGHACLGLAFGCRSVEIAENYFGLDFSQRNDNKVVCVTEKNNCGVDAIQVITGCTLGKSNLLIDPTDKLAFTFFDYLQMKSIRVVLKPLMLSYDHLENLILILESPVEDLFTIEFPEFNPFERSGMSRNKKCDICNKATPDFQLHIIGDVKICSVCAEGYSEFLTTKKPSINKWQVN